LSLSGCGHDQTLNSISIEPDNATVTGPGLQIHYTALGHYSHPRIPRTSLANSRGRPVHRKSFL